jgi:hypothetical protein
MKKSVRTLLAVCSLESDLSYSFPYVEGIVVIFLFTAFISVFSAVAGGPYINIRPGLAWNTTQSVATYEEYRNTMAASVYGVSALGFSYILAFLVPLLTTFTLTGHFEDGTLPTYLSYPISRSSLLLVKASMMIIVLGLSRCYYYPPVSCSLVIRSTPHLRHHTGRSPLQERGGHCNSRSPALVCHHDDSRDATLAGHRSGCPQPHTSSRCLCR